MLDAPLCAVTQVKTGHIDSRSSGAQVSSVKYWINRCDVLMLSILELHFANEKC